MRSSSCGSRPPVPPGLLVDDGIGTFSSLSFELEARAAPAPVRRWLGEVFMGRMLPRMAARALDDSFDFPVNGSIN